MFSEFKVKLINSQPTKMKSKFIITILIFMLAFNVFGQVSEKGKIGLSYSLGGVKLMSNTDFTKDLKAKSVESVGLIYLFPLKQGLEMESGLNYSLFHFSKNAELASENFEGSMSVIDIPIGVRATFEKYFFVNGGALLDFNTANSLPISSQSGIGLFGGLGFNYDFKVGLSLFANPYVKLHSIIPFGKMANHQRLMDAGVRIGVTYRL